MPSGTGILSPDAQIVSAGAACTRLRGMSPSVGHLHRPAGPTAPPGGSHLHRPAGAPPSPTEVRCQDFLKSYCGYFLAQAMAASSSRPSP